MVKSSQERFQTIGWSLTGALLLGWLLWMAWQARSGFPPYPIADPDSWGYLRPALTLLSGEGLQQTSGRDWLYSAMLGLFLKSTGSFAGIVLWQIWIGMGSVVLMLLAWRQWVLLWPGHPLLLRLLILVGVLPVFIQAVNPQMALFEHQIRPEAVLNFFVYAQLACLMGYCQYRWKDPRSLPALVLGIGCFLFAYACLLLKPSWLFAAAATTAPVVAGAFLGVRIRYRLLATLGGIALCGLLLWLPARILVVKDGPSRTFMPSTLVTIHADLIVRDLERRWGSLPETDPDKARLGSLLSVFREQLAIARTEPPSYRRLGFDADYLFYRSPLIDALRDYAGGGDEGYRAFCLRIYRDAFVHDPRGFLAKIGSQFDYFLFPGEKTFFRNYIDLAKITRDARSGLYDPSALRLQPDVQRMYEQYLTEVAKMTRIPSEIRNKSFASGFSRSLAAWALPLSLLCLVALVVTIWWNAVAGLRWMALGVLLLWSAPAGNALTVSIAHALDLSRYRYSLGGYYLFALVAMGVFLVVFVLTGIHGFLRARRAQYSH